MKTVKKIDFLGNGSREIERREPKIERSDGKSNLLYVCTCKYRVRDYIPRSIFYTSRNTVSKQSVLGSYSCPLFSFTLGFPPSPLPLSYFASVWDDGHY